MRHAAACVLLLALVVYVFVDVFAFTFVDFDDNVYLTANSRIAEGLTWSNIRWAFETNHHSNWHPLTWLSYLAEIQRFGLDPGVMHVTNALIHAANAALVYAMFYSLTGHFGPSLLVAALFAAHPLHVESVAWISERKDVLSTTFGLLSILAYTTSRIAGARRMTSYSASVLLYACSLASKPMLVTMPILLLLLDYWPMGSARRPRSVVSVRELLAEKIPFALLALASAWITLAVQDAGNSVQSFEIIPMPQRLANAAHACVVYLKQTLWPSDLAVFYPHPRGTLGRGTIVACGTLLVVLTLFAWRARARAPWLWFGWLWFAVSLAPVIGIVQVGGQALADRYTYVPLIGVFAVIAWIVLGPRPLMRQLDLAALSAAAVVALAVTARSQTVHWENTETLFAHAASVTERNVLASDILGRYYFDHNQLRESEEAFRAALAINTEYPKGKRELGQVLLVRNETREAVLVLEDAVELWPDDASAHGLLAQGYNLVGDSDAAAREYERAIELGARGAALLTAYGNVLAGLDRLGDALAKYDNAIAQDPDYAIAHFNRGSALKLLGRHAEADAAFTRASELDPELADAADLLRR